jgi:hypothetical protein
MCTSQRVAGFQVVKIFPDTLRESSHTKQHQHQGHRSEKEGSQSARYERVHWDTPFWTVKPELKPEFL